MKFIKKAAALIFCLALALSVMAVSASAAEEAQLLAATEDSTITLKLVDSSSGAGVADDVNKNDAKEYTSGQSGTVDIQLSSTSADTVVNAFEFTVGTGTPGATVTIDNVTGAADFPVIETSVSAGATNKVGKYTLSTNALAGVTVGNSAVTVATISFTITGATSATTPSLSNTINISEFKLFNTSNTVGNAIIPASTNNVTSVSVEIDPYYTVTVQNPVYSTTDYKTISSYTVYAASANSYKILAHKSENMTAPQLAYFDFAHKYVVASGSAGSWATLVGQEKTTAEIEGLLDGGASYGNVVLNAVYTPHKYSITVQKPTPSTENYTISTETPAYATDTSVGWQYDITGALYTSEGEANGAFDKVNVPHYDFKEYVAVASTSAEAGNWAATDKITPTRTASGRDYSYTFTNSVTVGKYGDVVLQATYTPHVYEITFKQPAVDSNGIITSGTMNAPNSDTASITYTVEGKENATSTANALLPSSATKTAYTFNSNYKLETASAGWANDTTTLFNSGAIGAGKHGDVTLVAQFTAKPYTVTYDLDGGAFTGTYNGVSAVTPKSPVTGNYTSSLSYTIEDTDDQATVFTFGTPVKAGYNFTGWTATHSDDEHSTFPAASTTASYEGMYGNVKLTANWAIEGKFATTDYWYGKSDSTSTDMLILFAVPAGNVPKTTSDTPTQVGAYKFGDNAMYTTTKYASVFTDLEEGVTYTIFAYIGSGTVTASSFSYDANAAANESIVYDGDVVDAGTKDAADYGNVVAMLANRSYDNNALSVKARLEADVSDGAHNDGEAGGYFGTIADVRAIMDKVLGKSTEP